MDADDHLQLAEWAIARWQWRLMDWRGYRPKCEGCGGRAWQTLDSARNLYAARDGLWMQCVNFSPTNYRCRTVRGATPAETALYELGEL